MSSAPISERETRLAPPEQPRVTVPEPEKPSGSGLRKWIVLLVIAVVVVAAVWKIRQNMQDPATQGQRGGGMPDRPTPVQVASVQQRTMPIYLTALGTVTAYNTVTIKSRVDGQLLRVNVREGQKVSKGQMLAEIDPAPYQATLAQAQGQLARDQATHTNDQAQAERYSALLAAGVVSRENAQVQQAAAGQSAGAVQADLASIQAAKVNLAYTRITSPIDGVVGLRQVDPGNIVHASDANGLLVVTQLQPITVIFTLPEDHLPDVLELTRAGKKLPVEAYDRSGATHLATGSVLTVDNQIDTTTGTVKVKAVFDNKDAALFPNQFVNIRLILEQRPDTLVIPATALLSVSNGNFVYVVNEGEPPADPQQQSSGGGQSSGRRGQHSGGNAPAGAGQGADAGQQNQPPHYAEVRPVKVDLTEGSLVILTSGVKAGEQVVVDGQEKLRNGSRVIPRQAAGPTGTGQRGNRGAGNGAGAANGAAAGAGTSTIQTPNGAGPQPGQGQSGVQGQGQHGQGQHQRQPAQHQGGVRP